MKYYRIVIYMLLLFYSFVLISLYYNYTRVYANKIPVITFHRLVLNDVKNTTYKDNQWVGSIDEFESMMKYLYENDYKTLSTDEFVDWYNKNLELPKKSILITFDDGFIEDYYLAYPILKKYNFNAVSFIVGSRIKPISDNFDPTGRKKSYIGQDIIDEIDIEYPNWEFQSHSYDLHKYGTNKLHKIRNISNYEIYEDVLNTYKYNWNVIAYPFGDYNDYLVKTLQERNYDIAFGFGVKNYAKRTDMQYNISRIKINGNANLTYLKNWLKYL